MKMNTDSEKELPMSKFNLRTPIHFEGINGRCYGRVIGLRKPRRGEFYLSGAIIEAYKAPDDLSGFFHVIIPTHRAIPGYRRGELVKLA